MPMIPTPAIMLLFDLELIMITVPWSPLEEETTPLLTTLSPPSLVLLSTDSMLDNSEEQPEAVIGRLPVT